jgi:hypothetical protein
MLLPSTVFRFLFPVAPMLIHNELPGTAGSENTEPSRLSREELLEATLRPREGQHGVLDVLQIEDS